LGLWKTSFTNKKVSLRGSCGINSFSHKTAWEYEARKEGDYMNIEEFKKELEERLLNFAVACVNISKELPRNCNSAGFEIGKQIVKSP